MILSRGVRQQTALRAAPVSTRPALLSHTSQRRSLHQVPQLTHGATFAKDGVEGVLSPGGFDIAWTQYQGHMVHKLNQLTSGTVDANALTKALLIKYARDANKAALFNHASMAHNNHLFFTYISPTSVPVPQTLLTHINTDFSSLDSLRAEFLATANAMFGPGFVWLVKQTSSSSLRILATYIAGSPYPGAHYRAQPVDMATTNTGVHGQMTPEEYARNRTTQSLAGAVGNAGSFGSLSKNARKMAPGGVELEPILCVNTWEHVWLRDWGVDGKRRYLEAWWEKINWNVVDANAGYLVHQESKKQAASRPLFPMKR
ncbi:fe superoxide dismutase [Lasallia pustulata]|uniref:Fe superoxide dismutase n=1 Tax=Lasallia pustulata TaxID=136370 RepID=A0A1W5CZM4_9LECA|nr:fe superoxide dismutase [Lasallia pustulata]